MRRGAPEAFQRARVIFDSASKILGPRPVDAFDHDDVPKPPIPVVGLAPGLFGAPLNPRLLALYDRVADRLELIHHCLDARRRRVGSARSDRPYWTDDRPQERPWRGDRACCEACGCEDCRCLDDADGCCLPCPYRFMFLVQKATELAGEVRSFGAALLGAFEKGDAEFLAYVRASHERQLMELALAIREDAWRAADWDVQALEKAKQVAQNQLQYYTGLRDGGLNAHESDYQDLTGSASDALTAATVSQTIATIVGPIPDAFIGTGGFIWLPSGLKLAAVFQGIAQISSTTAQILSTHAGLSLTQGGWDRRLAEWRHQVDVFTIQIDEIERQILAAQRRRDSALHELNNTRLQIDQAREVLDLQRDKFTSHALYLHLQRETAALHREMYDLALRAARHAERAFNFERGYTSRRFVPCEAWHDLREGLLAGERLALALRRMEKCYSDENVREYELTKHVSLRQLFPLSFLQLKLTGCCEIEVPEWLFDLDYPGHYMRRIKSVALTIPCVVGPYTGVHCRLTLLSSETRIVPWLLGRVAPCCEARPAPTPPAPDHDGSFEPERHTHRAFEKKPDHERERDGYEPRPGDVRIVRRYAPREAIATSSGQNDAGLFELNFRDERYLPFEFEGAVSRWRIELPPENNYFDLDTLSDGVMHMNYTAREGGDVLRAVARESSEQRVPDAGQRLFDVRQEMPAEWHRFHGGEEHRREFELHLRRDMFLFLPGHREVHVTRLEVFFEAPDAEPGEHRVLEFKGSRKGTAPGNARDRHEEHDREIRCVASAAWPRFFHGATDVRLGPLPREQGEAIGALRFEASWGPIHRLYVLCGYEAPRARYRGTAVPARHR
jgi:hypothetical protein